MAVWSRLRTSSSSLPTTSPSSSTPSSPASLHLSPFLDVADDLWFYSSVVPLPSLSFPCLPSLFSSSPDPSTLIAQCMITNFSPSPQRLPVPYSFSSSSPIRPAPDSSRPQKTQGEKLQKTQISPFQPADPYPAPPAIDEIYANTLSEYDENVYDEIAYSGDSSSSESDEDDTVYRPYITRVVGEDEEAYHYYTAPSDWDDDDAHHGYNVPSDCEDEQQKRAMKEELLPADAPQRYVHHEPDDALSGIYDVGVLLKDQQDRHRRRTREVPYSRSQREAMSRRSYLPANQARSHNEQKKLKENLKLWAHLVVSTVATQGRPLL